MEVSGGNHVIFSRNLVILTQYLKCISTKSKCISRGRAYTAGDTTYRVALCCFAHYGAYIPHTPNTIYQTVSPQSQTRAVDNFGPTRTRHASAPWTNRKFQHISYAACAGRAERTRDATIIHATLTHGPLENHTPNTTVRCTISSCIHIPLTR